MSWGPSLGSVLLLTTWRLHRLWKKKLIDWMNPNKGDYLIDIASGTGDVAKAFMKRTNYLGKVACVEPNKLMMNEGKKKLNDIKNINWTCSLAEKSRNIQKFLENH